MEVAGYRRKTRWSQKQTAFLIENAYKLTDEEISSVIGKTLKAIRRKRQNLGIVKACGRSFYTAEWQKKQAETEGKTGSPDIN